MLQCNAVLRVGESINYTKKDVSCQVNAFSVLYDFIMTADIGKNYDAREAAACSRISYKSREKIAT